MDQGQDAVGRIIASGERHGPPGRKPDLAAVEAVALEIEDAVADDEPVGRDLAEISVVDDRPEGALLPRLEGHDDRRRRGGGEHAQEPDG